MPKNAIVNKEIYFSGGSVSLLSNSDALLFSQRLVEEYAGKVQMIYCDPPLGAGTAYRFIQRVGEPGWAGKRGWQIPMSGSGDRKSSGVAAFIERMRPVLLNARELLCEDGCLYMHVDWRASAHMRILLDEVFGENNFVNEIIWSFPGGGSSNAHFSRKHDTIFLYKKSKSFFFDGTAIGERRGKERRNHLRRNVDDNGQVFFSIKVGGKVYRYYEDETIIPSDVWTDIPNLQQRDPERTGFETQKPLRLLQRMILSSSRPGDIVCDLFSGSGTTAQAALETGREILTCDINPLAAQITRRRMALTGAPFSFEVGEGALPQGWSIHADMDKNTVTLVDFNIAGMEHMRNDTLLPVNNTLADMWSVGRVLDGVYYVDSCSVRTQASPALADSLMIADGPGQPALHIAGVDCQLGWYLL